MIRRATEQDLPALFALNDVCYPKEAGDLSIHKRLSRVVGRNPTWVLDEDGVKACLISDISDGHPYIWSVATHPTQRGTGVASRLIQEFEKHYATEGHKHFWLHVRTENPAQKLYFDAGYRVASYLHNLYGPQQHGLIMRKRVG